MPDNKDENSEPFLILFYINKLIEKDRFFSNNNIAPYSKFSLSGKLLQHDFYQKINDDYKKIGSLSIKVCLVSDNAIEFIRTNIVFKNSSANTTVLSISDGKKLNYRSQNHEDDLYKAAETYAKESN